MNNCLLGLKFSTQSRNSLHHPSQPASLASAAYSVGHRSWLQRRYTQKSVNSNKAETVNLVDNVFD